MEPTPEHNLEVKLQRKYRAKGWTDNRIRRAVDQAKSAQRSQRQSPGSMDRDVTQFLAATAKEFGAVWFIWWWCSGNIESQRISPVVTRQITCQELTDESSSIGASVLYAVKA